MAFIVTVAGKDFPVVIPDSVNLLTFVPLLDALMREAGMAATYRWPEAA